MPNYIFITLLIFSPWLLFIGIMFYYAAISDKTFSFFITKKSQIYSYVSIIIGLGLLVSYIFISRLHNINKVINIYVLKDKLWLLIECLTISDIIILGLFIIFMVLGWWSTVNWLYICLRRRLLALYLYFYQYKWFYKMSAFKLQTRLDFYFYLKRRVSIFTKNEKILEFFMTLWPWCIWNVEKQLFRFILPYLLVFDILVHDGLIPNVFVLLPWFYIYTILRICLNFFKKIDNPDNIKLSTQMYGYGNRYA